MFNLFKSEFYKLFHCKSFKVLIFINILFSSFASLMFIHTDTTNGTFIMNGKSALISGFSDTMLLIIFSGIFAGIFVASEFNNGGMRNILSFGHSRLQAFLAKLIVYALGSLSISLVYPIILSSASTVIVGWGTYFTLAECLTTFRIVALSMLLHLSIITVLGVIAILVKESGMSIGICVGGGLIVSIILQLITRLFPQFDWIYIYSSIGQYTTALNDTISISGIIMVIIVALVTIFISGCCGAIHFIHTDLK